MNTPRDGRPHSRAEREQAEHDRRAVLDDLHQRLVTAVEQIESGADWRAWLAFARGLHHYSFRNLILIRQQRPDATAVASYRAWQAHGRQVRRGEKALRVLAPIIKTKPTVEPSEDADSHDPDRTAGRPRVVAFRAVPIFDIAQTDGDPVTPPAPVLLAGRAPDGLWPALVREATERGYRVTRTGTGSMGGANGRTDFGDREISIRHDVDDAQAVETLAHEPGRVLLHEPDPDSPRRIDCRGVLEVEAESVAYLLVGHHGVDAGSFSFRYVAHWAYAPAAAEHVPITDIVIRTGDRVMTAATQLISATADIHRDPDSVAIAVTARVTQAAEECDRIRADAASLTVSTETVSEQDRTVIAGVLDDSQAFFLRDVGSSWVPAYLAGRGLYETIGDRGIGHAPAGWTTLVDHLRSLGYADTHIEAAGMGTRARNGHLIDRFRDRMIIPIHDADHQLVAFVGRIRPGTPDDRHTPRYLNSPATALFAKSHVLFGLGEHLDQLRKSAVPVVCEGPLDAMAIDAAGAATQTPFVGLAACGTAFTTDHARQLHTVLGAGRVHLAFDADRAGQKATEQAWRRLADAGTRYVYAVDLPAGQDPADLIAANRGQDLVTSLICSPMAAITVADHILEEVPDVDTNLLRKMIAVRVLLDEHLALMAPDERQTYAEHLMARLGVDPATVAAEVSMRISSQMLETIEEQCKLAAVSVDVPATDLVVDDPQMSADRYSILSANRAG